MLGPVGAGKSTFAHQLAVRERAVVLILDDWMATLFGADERPATGRIEWYVERRDRVLEQILRTTEQLVEIGGNAVLELGLIQRRERAAFYARIDALGADLSIHVLDAPREVRRERVMRRNEERGPTFAQIVPPAFFELASDMWEPPDEQETAERHIRFV